MWGKLWRAAPCRRAERMQRLSRPLAGGAGQEIADNVGPEREGASGPVVAHLEPFGFKRREQFGAIPVAEARRQQPEQQPVEGHASPLRTRGLARA